MGVWYPEDRLRAALIPFAVLVPLPVLCFGLINKFIDGNLGLMLSLVCLFVNGAGVSGHSVAHIIEDKLITPIQVDMVFGAYVAYLVDVMHSRSSEILAANKFVLFHSIGHLEFKD